MHAADLIVQAADGLLLPGATGRRLINHYSLYAAFARSEEYRLVADGRHLGTMPVAFPIQPGTRLIFAGRRWQVLSIDDRHRTIDLTRSSRRPTS